VARKNKRKRLPTVGRIVPIVAIRNRVYRELETIAHRLAPIRALAWRLYGSRAALGRSHEDIRDADWMHRDGDRRDGDCLGPPEAGRAAALGVPARLWKATLDDVLADIKANRTAAKTAVIHNLYGREMDEAEREAKLDLLRHDAWFGQPLLRRLMRRQWKRGKTAVDTHIVLDTQCYTVRKDGGKMWLDVIGLTPHKRLAIPLASTAPITGTIRLILCGRNAQGKGRGQSARGGKLEIHHTVPEATACVTRPCGLREIGADKGYTEVFTDSDGERHGLELGKLLTAKSDANKVRYQGRQTLAAIADKHLVKGHYRKYERIVRHNLGKQKVVRQKARHRAEVRTKVFTATHALVDKAAVLVIEDLSRPIVGYDRGKNQNRRLSGWVKGLIQEAVTAISRRRGASVDCVNAAYTSQVVRCHPSFGRRSGDKLHCTICGAVYDVDVVAAENILERRTDREIGRFMPYRKVRAILEERFRLATRCVPHPAVAAETAQPRLQLGPRRRKAPSRQRRAK
jgi:IS605 OrfB family transposase